MCIAWYTYRLLQAIYWRSHSHISELVPKEIGTSASAVGMPRPLEFLRKANEERRQQVSLSKVIRWGGMSAVIGGALFVLGDLLGLSLGGDFTESAGTSTFVVQQVLFLLGTVLVLFGLFGLYARQIETAGSLGLVGFLVAFLGTALMAGLSWTQLFIVPFVAAEAPALLETEPVGSMLSFLTFLVGWLVFGVSTLRAGVYPRAAAILLIVGAVMPLVGFVLPASAFVFGIAVAWLGFVLFSGGKVSAEQLARES